MILKSQFPFKMIPKDVREVLSYIHKYPHLVKYYANYGSANNIKLYMEIISKYPELITIEQVSNVVKLQSISYIKEFFEKFPENLNIGLQFALERNDPEVIETISEKLTIEQCLKAAVSKKNVQWVKKFLEHSIQNQTLSECLIETSRFGDLEIVKILAKNNANHRMFDRSAFRCAVSNNHYPVIKFLYNLDENRNGISIYKDTFSRAIVSNNVKLVKIMLSNSFLEPIVKIYPKTFEMTKILYYKLDSKYIVLPSNINIAAQDKSLYFKTLVEKEKLEKELKKLDEIIECLMKYKNSEKALVVIDIMSGLLKNKIYEKNKIILIA